MEPKTRNVLIAGMALAVLALILPGVFFVGAASVQHGSMTAAPLRAPEPRPRTVRVEEYRPASVPATPYYPPQNPAPRIVQPTPAPYLARAAPQATPDPAEEHRRLVDATRQAATPAPVRYQQNAPTPMPYEGIAKRPESEKLYDTVTDINTGRSYQVESKNNWVRQQAENEDRRRKFREEFRDAFRRR